jgi:predicted enzyme related to lactoylglutathione lyase
MIRGIHGLLYSSDADATRAFFRDKVRLPGSDVGEGWLIFDFREGDLGIHPAEEPDDVGTHNVSIYCDDIEGTVRELKGRGVKFTAPVADHGYGLVTYFTAPGGITVQLYEPRYVKKGAQRSAKKAAARGGSKKKGKKAKKTVRKAKRR